MRNLTRIVIISGLFLLAVALYTCNDKLREIRPNIIVIFTDDQTYRAIGYSNTEVKTPILDELAAEGMIFLNNYTASPICVASRASMMTGMFPQQHGTISLDNQYFIDSISSDQSYILLARLFSKAGYDTWFAGKSHIGSPRDYGFQKGEETFGYNDSITFDIALDYIRSAQPGDKPFFFWLAPRQPHLPLLPTEKWLAKYDTSQISLPENFREYPELMSIYNQGLPGEFFFRDSKCRDVWKKLPAGPPRSTSVIKDFTKAYYATISHLDYQIGTLMDALKDKKLNKNTLIIFLSDNGYFIGNHGLGNKITMNDESVRVPMFIHWNGLKNKGIECRELVSSLDIFPTILELAGIPVPEHVAGKSLVPLFNEPGTPIHEYVASECVGKGGKKGEGHRMVRTKTWKYILTDINEEYLCDENSDPYEQNNLIGEDPERDNHMRQLMIQWMEQVGDTHQPPNLYFKKQ